ncbi:MAG: PAS domain-containing protein, partial [Deltaproteobacteria bacterium]|nr:PAS domain-containing protein [Deltaproteobacteria bacterium]
MNEMRLKGYAAGESRARDLHAEKSNVQLLLDAMPDSALLMDADGRVEACNRMAADRLDVSRNELLGLRIYDFLPQSVADARRRHVLEITRTKVEKTFMDVRDGRTFEHTVFPLLGGSGEAERFALFGRDVTSEVRAEKLVDVYETLVEHSPVGIARVSPEGSILYANKALSRMHGLAGPEGLVGRPLSDFYSGRSLRMFKEQLLLRRRGISSRYEVQCPGDDGVVRTLEVHGAPLHSRDGSFDGAIATVVDLTERKKTGDALQEQGETIRALFDATSDGVVMLNRGLRIEAVNEEFAKRLDRSPHEIVGRYLFDLIPRGEIARRRKEKIRSALDGGKPCRFEDARGERHYEHSVYPVFN